MTALILSGLLVCLCFCPAVLAQETKPAPTQISPEAATEQLVVFVSDAPGSAVHSAFVDQVLPEVRKLMDEMGVEVVVIDVSEKGAPEGITLTPQLVYQNHRGRFPYLGRFTTLERLKNHVRTARFGGAAKDIKSPSAVMPRVELGRATVGMPIKITSLAGTQPEGFGDGTAFVGQANAAIYEGLIGKLPKSTVTGVEADRLFYVDFYPYRSGDGQLFVSTALFSQFHCHEPVYTSASPVSGAYENAAQVFEEAAKQLRAEINRQLKNPEKGDGFAPIASDTPVVTYEALGLPLPPKPERGGADVTDATLSQEWTVDVDALNRGPMIQFRFPEPIVGYSGEATSLQGSVTLSPDLALPSATGTFTVPVDSVTMGERDLDAHIHSGILNAEAHPESTFKLERIETDTSTLAFGQVIPAVLKGTFTLKGIAIPLSVATSIEAYVAEDGKPRLSIQGTWGVKLNDPFNIRDQPPGPQDAATQLKFTCNILLKPAE